MLLSLLAGDSGWPLYRHLRHQDIAGPTARLKMRNGDARRRPAIAEAAAGTRSPLWEAVLSGG